MVYNYPTYVAPTLPPEPVEMKVIRKAPRQENAPQPAENQVSSISSTPAEGVPSSNSNNTG